MDKYIEAEKRLAELLGYKNVMPGADGIFGSSRPTLFAFSEIGGSEILPRWARDNSPALALMVEHKAAIEFYPSGVSARISAIGKYFANYQNHDNVEAATRFAIVHAVIAKLSAAAMICQFCGVDRFKEDCKGDRLACPIRGVASTPLPPPHTGANMSETVCLSVPMPLCQQDVELNTMAMLDFIMRQNRGALSAAEIHRIATWFTSKYKAPALAGTPADTAADPE